MSPIIRSPGGPSDRLIIFAGIAIAIIIFGPRSTFGLFVGPMTAARGWGVEQFALAIAIQQLTWGALQPLGGALADRFGAWKTVALGAVFYAVGMLMMIFAPTTGLLHLSAGVFVGAGLAGGGLPIVVAAVGQLVSERKRSFALGLVTAGSSLGQFAFAPLGQLFIDQYGWQLALLLLAIPLITLPILALPFRAAKNQQTEESSSTGLGAALKHAFLHPSYQLLVAGFFVCGFHVSFITVHLPPYFAELGIDAGYAALALSLIGLFNVFGAVGSGILGQRFSKRYLLSLLYSLRAIVITVFLLSDKSLNDVLVFSAALGLLWLSTVPLTSGLVATMFGTRHLGSLFGVVFFSHQIGAFIGIWLGGYLYEHQGSYNTTWFVAVLLSVAAALIHLPIREQAAPMRASSAPSA